MEAPETRYVKTEGGYLGYQVLGDGPLDLLFTTSPNHNIDVMWEEPSIARFFSRLAAFSRVICYNPRGTGISSPIPPGGSIESWMDDAVAVLDAVDARRAVIVGDTEGGPTAMLFAATYPERTSALVLINTFARFVRDADYQAGIPPEVLPRYVEAYERSFGREEIGALLAPSAAGDHRFLAWFARYQRLSMQGPGLAASGYRSYLADVDLRSILDTIRVPTLVMHRAQNQGQRVGHGRYLAKAIRDATYIELPGGDALYFVGDADALTDEIRAFLTGVREAPDPDRMLATILFTDIVGSTEKATALGDRKWRELLEAYYAVARVELGRYNGREIKTTGDGFLASFDGPARAIRCASAISASAKGLGVDMRAGLHTGECEIMGDDIGGIAVHIGARVAARALPGEVLVSRTVADLVTGSGIQFSERGEHRLKGVAGSWQLFAVSN